MSFFTCQRCDQSVRPSAGYEWMITTSDMDMEAQVEQRGSCGPAGWNPWIFDLLHVGVEESLDAGDQIVEHALGGRPRTCGSTHGA